MDDREFESFDTTAAINGQSIKLRVMGRAIHLLWGAGSGPQNGAGIVEAHRPMLEQIAAELIEQGQIWDDLVVITEADFD